MQRVSELPPPGWHTDPENSAEYRYWDGAQWTDHRAPRHGGPSGHRPVGALLAGSWGLMTKNWRPLLAIGAVIVVVYLVGEQVVTAGYDRVFGDTLGVLLDELTVLDPDAEAEDVQAVLDDSWNDLKNRLRGLGSWTVANGVLLMAVGLAVTTAANIVEFAAFGQITSRRLAHQPAGAATALLHGLRRLPRVFGVGLMLLAIWCAGLLLACAVPALLSVSSSSAAAATAMLLGAVLLAAMIGAAPYAFLALMTAAMGPATPSLSYARGLLRGRYWSTFGRMILIGVLYLIAATVLVLFAEFLGLFAAPLARVAAIVVSVFPEMLFSIACFTIYHDLGGEHADLFEPAASPSELSAGQ